MSQKYALENGTFPNWRQLELDVTQYLEEYNAKTVSGSGGGLRKGDVISDFYLIECKYTSKEAYSLSWKIWDKIYYEATNENKTPLFACRSQAGDFLVGLSLDFYDMIPHDAPLLGEAKSIKIDKEGFFNLVTDKTIMPLVIWKVNLKETLCK